MAINPALKLPIARSLQVLVHVGAFLPLLWLIFIALPQGRLGGDPVQGLTHFLGKGAIHLLYLTLCVSPLARKLKIGQLLRLRRPLGLWCFVWASFHFYVWLELDLQFHWALIGEEIIRRGYLLLGFVMWLVLLALAITSIPRLMRAMKRHWKRLHSFIYLTAILAPIHFWWSVKSGWIEPLLYLLVALFLLWLRYERVFRPLARSTIRK